MQEGDKKQSDFVDLTLGNQNTSSETPAEDLNQTVNSEQTTSSNESDIKPQQKKIWIPKKALALLLLFFFLILAGIGGVYAYKYIYLSPERVIGKMAENMSSVKTYKFEGSVNSAIRLNSDSSITSVLFPKTFGMNFSGDGDISDMKSPKASINFSVNANGTSVVNADLISKGEIAYLKLNSLVDLGYGDFDAIKNSWIKIDLQELIDKYDIDQTYVEENKLSQEQYEEIGQMIIDSNPLVIEETLSSVAIDNQQMFHYRYSFDKQKLKEILIQVADYYQNSLNIPKDPQEEKNLNEFFDSLGKVEGEIWIGKSDYLLHRITFSVVFSDNKNTDSWGSISTSMNLMLSGFNEDVEISTPNDYKSIDEVIGALFGGQFEQARDTQRRSDLLQITNAVYQYAAEHDGNLPGGLAFPKSETCIGTAQDCFDLASSGGQTPIVPTYIAEMPKDPNGGSDEDTGYAIFVDTNGRVEARAHGELTPDISVVR